MSQITTHEERAKAWLDRMGDTLTREDQHRAVAYVEVTDETLADLAEQFREVEQASQADQMDFQLREQKLMLEKLRLAELARDEARATKDMHKERTEVAEQRIAELEAQLRHA